MDNWADTLIIQYEAGRRGLGEKKKVVESTITDLIGDKKPHEIDIETRSLIKKEQIDKSHLNSMIVDMSFVIEWLKDGREPGKLRGIDKNSVYQVNSINDMDMFPSLDIKPQERELTEEEKQLVYDALRDLSPRERQAFICREAYLWSYKDIAKELGVGISTVQSYLQRAKEKLSCRKNAVTA